MTPLEQALKGITRAVRRLNPEQGRISRRNARRAVLLGVSRLKRTVDEVYPSIAKAEPKKEEGTGRRLTAYQRRAIRFRRWEARGWIRLGAGYQTDVFTQACAEACVAIRTRYSKDGVLQETRVPDWVAEIGPYSNLLRRGKHDTAARKALLAAKRLGAP